MRKRLLTITMFIATALTAWVLVQGLVEKGSQRNSSLQLPADPAGTLPFAPSSLGVEEDPLARLRYEQMMLADPATGKVPPGIALRALRFSQRLPEQRQLLALGQARTLERSYIARGPYNVGGRTRALAIDRSNEKIIIAGGVSGGVWRSEDEGISWRRTTPPDIINSVSCLVQDTRPGHTNTWYFGTGEYSLFNSARANNATPYRGDGIYKSTDGGRSWQALSATVTGDVSTFGSPFQYIYKLAVNSTNLTQDEVYAATIGGIIRSDDGGETWATTLGVDLLSEPGGTNLNDRTFPFFTEISIGADGTRYAAIGTVSNKNNDWPGAGIFRSADGLNWTKITPAGFPPQYRRIVITPSPSNPRVIYVLADAATTRLWKATYLTASGGYIWQDLSENIPDFGGKVGEFDTQSGYNMLLEVHPQNEDYVFLGGTNLYRSSDGFKSAASTAWIGGYDTTNTARQYNNHHADQHVLTFYSNPDRVLSGHDGGISVTSNGRAEKVGWTALNNGYITSQFFTVDIPKFEYSDLILGGMQDNGTYLRSAPGELPPWSQVFSGDGAYCQTTEGGTYWYVSAQQGQIYRLTFNSKYELTGYARIDPLGAGSPDDNGYLFINPFRLDPVNNNIMYLAGGSVLWRNANLSQITNGSQKKTSVNWEKLESTRIPEGQITCIELSVSGERFVLYGNSTGRLFRLSGIDAGDLQVEELTDPSFPPGFISSISVDPADPANIMVVFSNYGIPSVFYSGNGGMSFADISGNLEENPDGSGAGPSVRWGQLVPLRTGRLLAMVGTAAGLFVAEQVNGATTEWARESSEQIGYSVIPMLAYNPFDGRMVIATHGNGVFETTIADHQVVSKPVADRNFITGVPYPNPFYETIRIPLEIPTKQIVRAIVYNAAGQQVKTLVWGTQFVGPTTISWDGTNVTGNPVADGVYFCRIELESGTEQTVRLVLRH